MIFRKKLSSKEWETMHQLDTANIHATQQTKKSMKLNKMQEEPSVNALNVKESDNYTPFV